MINENENKKTAKLVFNPKAARRLLHLNFPIIDIKPSRSNPDATIHIFENTEAFRQAYDKVIEELEAKDKEKSDKKDSE